MTTKRFLRRAACAAAVAGLIGVLPAGAAVAANGADAPRTASSAPHAAAGNPWIYIGAYQYKSTCDSVGQSYHRQSYRCERDEPVYDLYVYYV